MKKVMRFLLPLLMAVLVVVWGGNQVMAQMSELVGGGYSQVLAVELNGAESFVEVAGEKRYFDLGAVKNGVHQIKSAIQSAVEGVKYKLVRSEGDQQIIEQR